MYRIFIVEDDEVIARTVKNHLGRIIYQKKSSLDGMRDCDDDKAASDPESDKQTTFCRMSACNVCCVCHHLLYRIQNYIKILLQDRGKPDLSESLSLRKYGEAFYHFYIVQSDE